MATTGVTQVNRGFKWVKGADSTPVHLSFPMNTGSTIYNGNVLTLSYTSGSVRLATEADTTVFGVAAHAVTAPGATEEIKVIPFRSDYVWEVVCAAGCSGGAPESIVGHDADLEIPTTGYHRVDTGAATLNYIIVGYHPDDKASTTRGNRLWVKCKPTMSIYEAAVPPGT